MATGRFVLLHDPSCPEPWEGAWRAVTFGRADLEPEFASDPVLADVGWSWLTEALEDADAGYKAESGTVTCVVSQGYGGLADDTPGIDMEIRASWTITDDAPEQHLIAWSNLLCTMAGLPPLPDGVVALPGRADSDVRDSATDDSHRARRRRSARGRDRARAGGGCPARRRRHRPGRTRCRARRRLPLFGPRLSRAPAPPRQRHRADRPGRLSRSVPHPGGDRRRRVGAACRYSGSAMPGRGRYDAHPPVRYRWVRAWPGCPESASPP